MESLLSKFSVKDVLVIPGATAFTRTRGAKTPDYLIEDAPTKLVIEIGGPSKGRQQFKGVQIDRKIVFMHSPAPEKGRLPLFLLGYLI